MKLSTQEFRDLENKRISLLGVSGIGKTPLANMLREHNWFHYSGDYRIGTRYLGEPILDNIKQQAMRVPFLRDLLRSDSIFICNITVDNLQPVWSFLGKLGNPEQGGLTLKEFKRRQALNRHAEIAAMKDVPGFVSKAQEIYGYQHFVNNTSESLCDLEDPEVIELLAAHTLIVYVQATERDEHELLRRAKRSPRPLFYRDSFLDEQLAVYMKQNDLPYVALIEPEDFVRWMFPNLFRARTHRYEEIAAEYGYTLTTEELAGMKEEADFLYVLEQAVARGR